MTFVAACQDGIARIWEVPSGTLRFALKGHTAGIVDATFSPDGAQVLTGSDDKTARIWDATTGRSVRELRGHEGAIHGVAWSPNASLVATASLDRTVRVWDGKTGREVWILRGHSAGVEDVAFSADGRWLASISADRTVRVWDLDSGTTVQVFAAGDQSELTHPSVVFAKDRPIIAAGGQYTKFLECTLCVGTQELRRIAETRLTRGFTAEERRQFSL
jgi:WD40 repeat protein